MKAILKAKHWQVFILLLIIPVVSQIFFAKNMFEQISNANELSPESIVESFRYFPIAIILSSSIFFFWFWSMGVGLQAYISIDTSLKVTVFKIFLLIPFIYMSFISVGIMYIVKNTGSVEPWFIWIIMPLHLFSIFCIFFCIYFIAKTIKTAELKREVVFSDFVGEFFLLMFYPIGIWILQPKINKLVNEPHYFKN